MQLYCTMPCCSVLCCAVCCAMLRCVHRNCSLLQWYHFSYLVPWRRAMSLLSVTRVLVLSIMSSPTTKRVSWNLLRINPNDNSNTHRQICLICSVIRNDRQRKVADFSNKNCFLSDTKYAHLWIFSDLPWMGCRAGPCPCMRSWYGCSLSRYV